MTIKRSHIVQCYVDSRNRHDVQSILSCFSGDVAAVYDKAERCVERKLSRTGLLRHSTNTHSISNLSASKTIRQNLHLEGGSEDQLLSSTAKSRRCTIAAELNSNDLGDMKK